MQELINDTILNMQMATSQQLEQNFGTNFSVKYNLPENLKVLDAIYKAAETGKKVKI